MIPVTSHQILDLGIGCSPGLRYALKWVVRAFEEKDTTLVIQDREIESLRAKLERHKPKRRKAKPNPNYTFTHIDKVLTGEPIPDPNAQQAPIVVDGDDEVVQEVEYSEDDEEAHLPATSSRYGRLIQKPRQYQ